jgi:uncharacterized protein GlcG (DUF336 family)
MRRLFYISIFGSFVGLSIWVVQPRMFFSHRTSPPRTAPQVINRLSPPSVYVPPSANLAAANQCLMNTAGCSVSSMSSYSQPAKLPYLKSTGTQGLAVSEVERIVSQAVGEAQARNARATIAVTDRVGNVLVVYQMAGASGTFNISGGRGVNGGLENISVLPSSFAAISKALTGAYLSSKGNAFSSRTASQIVQDHFNPGQASQPAGPLFGVQFSQLSCSDLMRRAVDGMIGPKRSPLGLSADPGGLPLYKNGEVVGGIGVISDGIYGLDLNIIDIDQSVDELIAVAGTSGFSAPVDIQAQRISVDGRTLRFVDSTALLSNPAAAAPYASLPGAPMAVPGYVNAFASAGTVFGTPISGIRPDTGAFAGLSADIVVDALNANRYPPIAGTDGLLTQNEVTQILSSALSVANRARAQIRRPLSSPAQVTISIVDTQGAVLGLIRSADAPVFGTDVSLQKARTAAFFSNTNAAIELQSVADASYLTPAMNSSVAQYVTDLRAFLNNPNALSDGVAYSNRAVGNLARPYFPDGIDGAPRGPLSKSISNWSPFSQGLQLDVIYNNFIATATGSPLVGCTGLSKLQNGIQIFPGSVPIYRGSQLVGGIGVSGDGIDQDDMISFLGLANAGLSLNTGIANAPLNLRADTIVPAGTGTRLRYVQCPQSPFINSTAQNVCAGF